MINVIPRPRVAVEEEGYFELPKREICIRHEEFLGNMRQCVACTLGLISVESCYSDIAFIYSDKMADEEYVLKITEAALWQKWILSSPCTII